MKKLLGLVLWAAGILAAILGILLLETLLLQFLWNFIADHTMMVMPIDFWTAMAIKGVASLLFGSRTSIANLKKGK